MAPNYGEESKNPKKIVPRAMYISVIGLGIFYVITSWAAISAYPTTAAAALVASHRRRPSSTSIRRTFGNQFLSDAMSYLIITGSFACGMAFHNTTARYFYSLGREKVLPSALGRTHPKYRSPHIASITQSVIAAADRARVLLLHHHGARTDRGVVAGLRAAVRPGGVHGRGADPVHPGAGLGGDLELLPDPPCRRAPAVEPHHRAADLGGRPAGRAVRRHRQDRLPGRRLPLRVVPGRHRCARVRRRYRSTRST